MPLFGYGVFLLLLVSAKLGKILKIGPRWLRNFTLERSTYY